MRITHRAVFFVIFLLAISALACATFRSPGDPAPTAPSTAITLAPIQVGPTDTPTPTNTLDPNAEPAASDPTHTPTPTLEPASPAPSTTPSPDAP